MTPARPGEGGALLRQLRLLHLSRGRAGKRPHPARSKVSEHLRIGMENAMAAENVSAKSAFSTSTTSRLIAGAPGTIRRVYEFLGLNLDHATSFKMKEWQAINRSGAGGAHRCTPADFRLSTEKPIHSDYRTYIEHFGVEVEGGRMSDWTLGET